MSEIVLAFDDAGSGPVVMLLHGYPFDRSMWREQIGSLNAGGWRAVAPDLRGFGETSDKLQFVDDADQHEPERQAEARRTFVNQITTMDDMARDVAHLMDRLRIDRAVICGLSMGGYVAFEFAKLFAGRMNGLVLAGTRAPADNDEEKKAREQQVKRILSEGMTVVADTMLPRLLAQKTCAEKPAVIAHVREMILHTDPKSAAAAQRGMACRRHYSNDLSNIEVPTLIVVGREDTIRPVADAEFMHRGIRGSRLEIIGDAAHMTNMEQPDVFNRALIDLLRLIH